MLHLTKIQIAAIAGASVLASFAAAGSFAPQQKQMSATDALLELQYADAAAVDYFLQIDGIPGESTDERHGGWIQIESFSWGMSQSGAHHTGSGGGAGKVNVADITITKFVDKSSPLLFKFIGKEKPIPSAVIDVVRAGGDRQPYIQIELDNLLVSSYQISGSSGGVPTDSLSLNFTKITYTYRPPNPDGSLGEPVTGTFDLSPPLKK